MLRFCFLVAPPVLSLERKDSTTAATSAKGPFWRQSPSKVALPE
jgi:hypothetical protein